MTEICGRRRMASNQGSSSVSGSSIATTAGRSARMRRRTSMANSRRPGTTGRYESWPRVRLDQSGSDPGSPDIPQSLLAQSLDQRGFEGVLFMLDAGRQALELDRVARNVDAIANAVALIGGMRLLQEVGDVLQDAVLRERNVFLE